LQALGGAQLAECAIQMRVLLWRFRITRGLSNVLMLMMTEMRTGTLLGLVRAISRRDRNG